MLMCVPVFYPLQSGPPGRPAASQTGDEDPVGQALGEMQARVQKELDRSSREVERARRDKDRVGGPRSRYKVGRVATGFWNRGTIEQHDPVELLKERSKIQYV